MARRPVIFLVLAFASIAVYAQSLRNDFVAWDDDALITGNPLVQEFTTGNVYRAFTSYDPELYVPLTTVSFQAEHALAGDRPFLYRLDNLLLHIVASFLVFLFLRRLKVGESAALLCALLFAVHPLNVEAVAWASARKDLLSSVFALASLLSYLDWKDGRRWKFWMTLLFLLLSLLSKPTAIVLPLIFLLLDGREKSLWPFFGLSALFLVIGLIGKAPNVSALTPVQTLLLAAKSTVLSSSLFFFPRFSLLFHQATPVTVASPEFFVPLLLIPGAILVLWLMRKRAREVLFAVLFFLTLLVPSFANFSKEGNIYVTSDRYLYLPQIGFLFLLGLALMRLLAVSGLTRRLTITAFALLLCVSAASSSVRSLYWRDSETLFERALARNPGSAELHHNLGFTYQNQGSTAEAVTEYRAALRLDPLLAETHFALGVMAQKEGRMDEALAAYRRAAESDRRFAEPHNNIGAILLDRGDTDGAIVEFRKAIELYPRYVQARLNLADAYGKKGMYAEGLEQYRAVMEIDPALLQ